MATTVAAGAARRATVGGPGAAAGAGGCTYAGARGQAEDRPRDGPTRWPRAPGAEAYPEAVCELDHDGPYQLLVATILSAQSTDARVNQVTPALFARYPTPADLADADPEELEELIRSTGFFRAKTRSLVGMATRLVEAYGGEVPGALADLTTLPGVGRKTANVIRSRGARAARPPGRHARDPAVPTPGSHHGERSREDRAGAERHDPGRASGVTSASG